jgi:serine/threonine protein kinase
MHYSQKTDVWSSGILAYQLLTARLPFLNEDGTLLVSDLQQLTGGDRLRVDVEQKVWMWTRKCGSDACYHFLGNFSSAFVLDILIHAV